MTKYDFTVSTNQMVKTNSPIMGDNTRRIETFMRPSISLAANKIAFFESGTYRCALSLSEIGNIGGVAPLDIVDAVSKFIALIATITV